MIKGLEAVLADTASLALATRSACGGTRQLRYCGERDRLVWLPPVLGDPVPLWSPGLFLLALFVFDMSYFFVPVSVRVLLFSLPWPLF